jgi:hypothetical protein
MGAILKQPQLPPEHNREKITGVPGTPGKLIFSYSWLHKKIPPVAVALIIQRRENTTTSAVQHKYFYF